MQRDWIFMSESLLCIRSLISIVEYSMMQMK